MDSSSNSITKRKTSLDMDSSSSSLIKRIKGGKSTENHHHHYDVFISFRGEDTRTNFTSHLYAALCRKQIKAFIDSEDLRIGHEISGSLVEAIEKSKLYLVIFSPNYGSSRWCLMELEKILQCSKQHEKRVIPVFYKVDPSHVRHQTGSFTDAFAKHETREEESKVQSWRVALNETAGLCGLHLNHSHSHRLESEFIHEIGETVLKILHQSIPLSTTHPFKILVGINSHIEKVMSLLCMDQHSPQQVRSVGIWGMGGIGKTTIVEAVFCRIRTQFDGYYFFENVREELKRLRKDAFWNKVLSQVLEGENLSTLSLRLHYVRQRLGRKRVFIVFDDVDESIFLEIQDLAEHHDLFAMGSKIIVTSRDKQVLRKLSVDEVYEVVGLEYEEALKLFSLKAFRKELPLVGYLELSNRVVYYARGNPLALTILGLALLGRDEEYWDDALAKMKNLPKQSILDVLRISYDGLSREERDAFLDIACFFKGEDKDHVKKLLGCFYDGVSTIITHLMDKSLITISQQKKIELHDLVQEMGWKMDEEEEVTNDPQKRKRLHKSEDIYRVLTGRKGTGAIQGISLNVSEGKSMSFGVDAFTGMVNLRWLKVYGQNDEVCLLNTQRMNMFWWLGIFGNNYEGLLPRMRYLHWEAFPLKSLSSTFNVQNLVKLSLPESKVERLWTGIQDVANLRWMDLSRSRSLIETPDLSKAKNMESIILESCAKLTRLHPSVQYLDKLQVLNLDNCGNLSEITSVLESKVMRVFSLRSCIKIKECPKFYGNKLEVFGLAGSKMKEVPDCGGFQFLEHLVLFNCPNITKFPKMLPSSTLNVLRMWNTGIEELPSSIQFLTGLRRLKLIENSKLRSIPDSLSRLGCLSDVIIHGCKVLSYIPVLPTSVEFLQVVSCPSIERLSPISNQSQLDELYLLRCGKLDHETLTNVVGHFFFKLQRRKHFRAFIPRYVFPEWSPRKNESESSITLQKLGPMSTNLAEETGEVIQLGPFSSASLLQPHRRRG